MLCCALFWITVAAELSTDSGAKSTRPDGRAGLGCWDAGPVGSEDGPGYSLELESTESEV